MVDKILFRYADLIIQNVITFMVKLKFFIFNNKLIHYVVYPIPD